MLLRQVWSSIDLIKIKFPLLNKNQIFFLAGTRKSKFHKNQKSNQLEAHSRNNKIYFFLGGTDKNINNNVEKKQERRQNISI